MKKFFNCCLIAIGLIMCLSTLGVLSTPVRVTVGQPSLISVWNPVDRRSQQLPEASYQAR